MLIVSKNQKKDQKAKKNEKRYKRQKKFDVPVL